MAGLRPLRKSSPHAWSPAATTSRSIAASALPQPIWRGVELRYLPALRHKYFETLQHTCVSTVDLMSQHNDVALYCNAANAIFTPLARMSGYACRFERRWIGAAPQEVERLRPVLVSDVRSAGHILSECDCLRCRTYSRLLQAALWPLVVVHPLRRADRPRGTRSTLADLGLEPRRFFLYVTRFEPENNPLLVRTAFEQVETDLRLALIGDAPYAQDYIRAVKNTTDPRIVIPGGVYGAGYHELQANSFAYIHATEVGGTHPALIEAMGRGALVLYLWTEENHEVAGGAGLPFANERDLVNQIRAVLAMSEDERQKLRDAAVQRVRDRYSWDAVTSSYERLFESLVQGTAG